MQPHIERVTLRISGQVQGVFYRVSTQQKARALGLVGWVRNRGDGSVEATCEGPRQKLDEMISWCEAGPPHARVDSVEATFGGATGEFEDFAIRR